MAVQRFKTTTTSTNPHYMNNGCTTRGGTVVPGTYFNGTPSQLGEVASAVRVGNDGSATGTLVLEQVDGTEITFPFVKAGETIRHACVRVVSTGTTCTNIVWLGGN